MNDYEGFSNWEEVNDHENIQKQVSQMVLIDPFTIIDAFGIKASAPKPVQDNLTRDLMAKIAQ